MTSFAIIIFSHTQNYHLWSKLQLFYNSYTDIFKIFVSNKTNTYLQKPTGFQQYIEYEDNYFTYSKKCVEIMKQINAEYILFINENMDNQCIDCHSLNILFNYIKSQNIDRCSLKLYNSTEFEKLTDTLQICNLKNIIKDEKYDNLYYNIIWKKKIFINMHTSMPYAEYNTNETNNIIKNYIKNIKSYGLIKN
jgi:hypothetical protein